MRAFIYSILFGLYSSGASAQLMARPDTSPIKTVAKPATFTVPEIPAQFPGGVHKLNDHFFKSFTSKVTASENEVVVFHSPVAQWTIDETGKVTDAKIIRSSNITRIDQQFLEAIKSMPAWKPAEHNGKKVRQNSHFPVRICFK